MRDYYDALDVAPDATDEEIKAAYRFHIKAFHPDKFTLGTEHARNAQRRTEEIIEAYGVLSKPHFRAEYDRFRKYTTLDRETPTPRTTTAAQHDNAFKRHWNSCLKAFRSHKRPVWLISRAIVLFLIIAAVIWTIKGRTEPPEQIATPESTPQAVAIAIAPSPTATPSHISAPSNLTASVSATPVPAADESVAEAIARGDYSKAAGLFKKEADAGDSWAQESLGELYETGKGVSKDYQKAFALYEMAAAQGSVSATVSLARLYDEGKGVKRDYAKAAELFDQAASKGSAEAMTRLGWLFAHGRGVQQDYSVAVAQYERALATGYVPAATGLGLLYELGHGVIRDYKKAAELYLLGADQNDAWALNSLANLYASGKGVERDDVKAVELLERAVFQEYPPAQFNLSWFYADGKGVEADFARALLLLQKAAAHEFAPAQTSLGELYAHGESVAFDYEKAAGLFRKAAAQEDPDAFNALAWLLATCPDDLIRNGKEAITSATKACESTQWKDANVIGTLSAAYAEAGDFGKAVSYARQSLRMTSLTVQQRREMEYCLDLFKHRRPYRDENRFTAPFATKPVDSFGASEAERLNIRASKGTADAFNDLAWFLATYPDDSRRDGKRAVFYARKACQLSKWGDSHFISTLAAAYAETGQFDKAVRFATEALATEKRISGSGPENFRQRMEMQSNLELYQDKKPYRQEPRR